MSAWSDRVVAVAYVSAWWLLLALPRVRVWRDRTNQALADRLGVTLDGG